MFYSVFPHSVIMLFIMKYLRINGYIWFGYSSLKFSFCLFNYLAWKLLSEDNGDVLVSLLF